MLPWRAEGSPATARSTWLPVIDRPPPASIGTPPSLTLSRPRTCPFTCRSRLTIAPPGAWLSLTVPDRLEVNDPPSGSDAADPDPVDPEPEPDLGVRATAGARGAG